MEEWGAVLLKFYNKNTSLKDTDVTSNYLSYWTDNGLYNFCDKKLYKIFMKSITLFRRILLLVNRRWQRLSNTTIRYCRLFN